ncbi:MAG: hypothetical protein PW791_13445 [Neorhizobium sp.]|nr:hypothetical protein [Neorhizobium sp.]
MRKIVTAAAFSFAFASAALAQQGNSGSQNSSDSNHMQPPQQAEPLIKGSGDGAGATDPTTTDSTTGQGTTGGTGSQNMPGNANPEKCTAGAPTGGDMQAMPGATQSAKPNCP